MENQRRKEYCAPQHIIDAMDIAGGYDEAEALMKEHWPDPEPTDKKPEDFSVVDLPMPKLGENMSQSIWAKASPVRLARLRANLSTLELSDGSGVTRRTLHRIETGETRAKTTNLIKLARFMSLESISLIATYEEWWACKPGAERKDIRALAEQAVMTRNPIYQRMSSMGHTVLTVEAATGLSRSTIYPLLKDPNRQPTVDTLESMAKELDWSVPLIFEAWYGWAAAYRAMDPGEALIHAQFERQE